MGAAITKMFKLYVIDEVVITMVPFDVCRPTPTADLSVASNIKGLSVLFRLYVTRGSGKGNYSRGDFIFRLVNYANANEFQNKIKY